jgi:hypothetical protein
VATQVVTTGRYVAGRIGYLRQVVEGIVHVGRRMIERVGNARFLALCVQDCGRGLVLVVRDRRRKSVIGESRVARVRKGLLCDATERIVGEGR